MDSGRVGYQIENSNIGNVKNYEDGNYGYFAFTPRYMTENHRQ